MERCIFSTSIAVLWDFCLNNLGNCSRLGEEGASCWVLQGRGSDLVNCNKETENESSAFLALDFLQPAVWESESIQTHCRMPASMRVKHLGSWVETGRWEVCWGWGHPGTWTHGSQTGPESEFWDSLLLFSHSVESDSVTPWTAAHQASLSFTISQSLLKIMLIESIQLRFSSHLQSFPASVSFLMSQLFASGDQSIGASGLASVLPMNIQDSFPLRWTGWISLQSKRLSRVFSNTTVQKHQFFSVSLLYDPTLTSIQHYWKNHSFD